MLLDIVLSLAKIFYMMGTLVLVTWMVKVILWVWRKATPNAGDRGLNSLKYLSFADVWFVLFLIISVAKSVTEILEDVAKLQF